MAVVDALAGRDLGLAVHGNRVISAMVFRTLPVVSFGKPAFDDSAILDQAQMLVI